MKAQVPDLGRIFSSTMGYPANKAEAQQFKNIKTPEDFFKIFKVKDKQAQTNCRRYFKQYKKNYVEPIEKPAPATSGVSKEQNQSIKDYVAALKQSLKEVRKSEREREYDRIWMDLRHEFGIETENKDVMEVLYDLEDKMLNTVR